MYLPSFLNIVVYYFTFACIDDIGFFVYRAYDSLILPRRT